MKKNQMKFALLASLILLICLTACAPQVLTPSPGDIQTALAETLAAEPSETIQPTKAMTNTPAPSPTPFQTPTPTTSPPISGSISAAFLNLRAGPSTFFDIIQTFVEGTQLTAIARTPDSKWVQVEIEFEDDPTMQGWMAVLYLDLAGDPSGLPEEPLGSENTLTGTVEDTEGNPISGITVAFILSNDQVDLRADAVSDEEGIFTAYLPDDLFGTFDVQIVSWSCESPIADANCQLSGYIELEDRAFVTTPQEEDILFIYEATDMLLNGSVEDANDDPVDRILVVAERDDGATSLGRSDALGDFSIPITSGTWEIYTVIYDPEFLESERLSVEIVDEAPLEITVEAPIQ